MSASLVIRADAGIRIGTGHVMRCIALGQVWRDAGGPVVFITTSDIGALRDRLDEEHFDVRIIPDRALSASEADVSFTIETSRQVGAKWVVVDGYSFDLNYQQAIRRAELRLLLIDDYCHLPEYEADILLNQNIGAEQFVYAINDDCRKLLGLRYVLLRKEFRDIKPRDRRAGSLQHLLVTMGGSDPDNVNLAIIEALESIADIPESLLIRILVGAANPHWESLSAAAKESRLRIELVRSVSDMSNMLQWADFAITAAGSTCWELIALGVPFITIILAENQKGIAHGLADLGFPCVGSLGDEFSRQLRDSLGFSPDFAIRHDQFSMPPHEDYAVDGFGPLRILSSVANSCGLSLISDRLSCRSACRDDQQVLLDWVNDSVTRANSFHDHEISYDEHAEWFLKHLEDPKALLLIGELDGRPCGYVRYELDSDGRALLSFAVSSCFRSMGLSWRLVRMSFSQVQERLGTRHVVAYSFVDNTSAHRSLLRAGMVEQPTLARIHDRQCRVYFAEV
jgi:UDP-2,4-diacetamido-2,4,6-trideoxy-beta-L-altropyranose hydrolase